MIKKFFFHAFGWPLPACRTGRFRDCDTFSGCGYGFSGDIGGTTGNAEIKRGRFI